MHGWSPEEIQWQYSHLSLADVHAAMAFYYDHQAEIDAQLERDRRDYERLRAAAGESAIYPFLPAASIAPMKRFFEITLGFHAMFGRMGRTV